MRASASRFVGVSLSALVLGAAGAAAAQTVAGPYGDAAYPAAGAGYAQASYGYTPAPAAEAPAAEAYGADAAAVEPDAYAPDPYADQGVQPPADPAAMPPPPAGAQPTAVAADYDPWEGTNRGLFRFNKGLDRSVIRPVAIGYQRVTPRPVRNGLRNVLNNLGEPKTFVNDVLQGSPSRAGQTLYRFVTNSTIGVLGVFDVAGEKTPRHDEDFGQTMGRWGVGQGAYVYLPVLGPSTVRDATGRVVDLFLNPINLLQFDGDTATKAGLGLADGVDTRARLDPQLQALERTATDEYAAQRSLYLQNRTAAVRNGEIAVDELPDFGPPTATPPPPRPRPVRPAR